MRGGIYEARFDGRGSEQRGLRYAVALQNNALNLSTMIVAPTTGSDSAAPAPFRTQFSIGGEPGRILIEQMRAFDARYLGEHVGMLTAEELWGAELAIMFVMDLRRAA